MDKAQILQELSEITSQIDFYKVLSLINKRDFCGPANKIRPSGNIDSYLNENEFEFLSGLWVRNAHRSDSITFRNARVLLEKVTKLMAQLHWAVTPKLDNLLNNEEVLPEEEIKFYENGDRLKEAIFYGDAGAYEHQLTNYIKKKYSLDVEWLLTNKGLDLSQIESFATNLRDLLLIKLNEHDFRNKLTPADFNLFLFSKHDLAKKNEVHETILNLLTVNLNRSANSQLVDIGDYNELSAKPFIKLPDGRYFITSTFQVSKALYETPFYWMLSDDTYLPIAQKNRGNIAENIVTEILSSMFDNDTIFPNVVIRPNRQKTVTDIDVLLIHNSTALIFQVKSKRLTLLSKQGNIESIKKDISGAFGDAYIKQGLIAREILLEKRDKFQFDNIPLERISQINECIIIVVTLDYYPALMSQIYSLVKPDDRCHPIGISIFDLDIILKILKTKNNVIEYFSKRAKYSGYYLADSEMDMLGFYLKNGLKKPDKAHLVYIDHSWSRGIDVIVRTKFIPELHSQKLRRDTITKNQKIGRNDPCFCGSGLKYKLCHWKS